MAQRSITTDRQIQGLQARDRPYFATVRGCPGLRIKIQASSTGPARTFLYRYRAPDGRLAQKVIGRYVPSDFGLKEARERWREYRNIRQEHGYVREYVAKERAHNIAEIKAATAKSERDPYTVQKLANEYVEHQSARITTWRKTDRNLKIYVLPDLGERPAHEIKRRDVLKVIDDLTRRGLTVTANRVLAAVRAMFNWAIEREKHGLAANPCASIKPQKERGRERMLDDIELGRVFSNMSDSPLGLDERDLLQFILLTGCRLSEAAGARAQEFDLDAAVWILPAGRSKNRRELRLPLSKQAKLLVERRCIGLYVFPMNGNDSKPMRGDHIHTPLRKALPSLKVQPFTPHDLRRSTASGLAALGAPRDIVRRVLNHTDRSVTSIYDRADYAPQIRRWLQKWANHLDAICGVRNAVASK